MLKKLVLFVAAVMLLASSAHALVNDVAVKTTSPKLVRGICGEVGSLSLTFDKGTVVDSSQAIEVVLQGGKFCKPVDLYVNATAGTYNSDTNGSLQGNYTVAAGPDFVMHVTAAQGGTTLLMHVMKGSLTAGTNGAQLVLFNGQRGIAGGLDELLIGSFNGTDWKNVTNETAAANSLCVESDLPEYTNLLVSLGPTTSKYKFDPASPTIAVITGASTISVVKPKSDAFMKVPGEQASCSFSYENSTCDGSALSGSRYFALKNGGSYPSGEYTLTMELLVNGAAGDNGVYFEAPSAGFQFANDLSVLKGPFTANRPASAHQFYLGTGAKTTKAPASGCDRPDDQKITKIVSKVVGVNSTVTSMSYLRVNVPSVAVAKSVAGDEIAVKITITQGRCSTLFADTYKLFKMVDKCPADAEATSGKLVFPYFADAPYWNGMALTNTGTAPVNATLAIVDAKGGKASIDVVVPAEGMYVDLLENIIMGQSATNGTVNYKERCYIIVTPQSGNLKGFAMMGNAGESMGYTVNND